jgi:hypothetical protein
MSQVSFETPGMTMTTLVVLSREHTTASTCLDVIKPGNLFSLNGCKASTTLQQELLAGREIESKTMSTTGCSEPPPLKFEDRLNAACSHCPKGMFHVMQGAGRHCLAALILNSFPGCRYTRYHLQPDRLLPAKAFGPGLLQELH